MTDSGRTNNEYKKWRAAVFKRDNGRCKWPDCKKRAKEVHHVVPYSTAPHLRTETSNGICLCKTHHNGIKNKEIFYVSMFLQIIKGQSK